MTQKSKAQKIAQFDPDGVGDTGGNIFGLPFTIQESDVVIIPVPWDVTVSNFEGTSRGPENILQQSFQIDLYDETVQDPWKAGIAMEPIDEKVLQKNHELREKARAWIRHLEEPNQPDQSLHFESAIREINQSCQQLCQQVREKCLAYLSQNKLPVILGGDHSTPLGLMQALAQVHDEFGVLHIDAHADLRPAYEGFDHSHASVMYNASQLSRISSFVQVGLRDMCGQEAQMIENDNRRFHAFFARDLHTRLFRGQSWAEVCHDIVGKLPSKVYISFDIDGLDPAYCASTGTPVPGGLSYDQALFLIEQVVKSGKQIIGFDLVETGPDAMDGIIACRLLYKTIAQMLLSNQRI